MVAYSFQSRFAMPIVLGEKRRTIRANRKRHARPGEPLQLYVGMRTRHCRKIICDPVCIAVEPIRIQVPDSAYGSFCYWTPMNPAAAATVIDGEFAYRDGFGSVGDMLAFWLEKHGPGLFEGVLIQWRPNEEPADASA